MSETGLASGTDIFDPYVTDGNPVEVIIKIYRPSLNADPTVPEHS